MSSLDGNHILRIERGEVSPGTETLARIAEAFNRPASVLLGERRPTLQEEPKTLPGFYVQAGSGADFDDMGHPSGKGDFEIVPPAYINDPNAYALRVKGLSMAPLIREGSVVIVSPKLAAQNGDIVVARLSNGDVTLKFYYRKGDVVDLRAINPMESIRVHASEVQWVRKVVWVKP